jgi:uncharacterized membrane protein (DUF2068 family)
MAKNRAALLRLIGGFKLLKASLLIALGVGGLLAMPDTIADVAQRAVAWIDLFPGHDQVQHAIGRLRHIDEATAAKFGAVSLAYGAVFLVEGVGLLLEKRWAEWMTVGVTSSFLPIEIYELARHVSAGKIATLALNLAIVGYLVYRRVEERHRFTVDRILRAVGAA